MANKELTARVKLNIGDFESKINTVVNKINSVNKAVNKNNSSNSAEKQLQREAEMINKIVQKDLNALHKKQQAQAKAFMDEQRAYEKHLQQKQVAEAQAFLNAEKAREKAARAEQQALQKQMASAEKLVQSELDGLHRKQAAQAKVFFAEQNAYNNTIAKAEQLKQKELERERIRQQSLTALGEGDKAAARLKKGMEQVKRVEYEAWWQAQLTNQEWRKAHPLLTKIADRLGVAKNKTVEWGDAQIAVLEKLKGTHRSANNLLSTVKRIAATWLGIASAKKVMDVSDTITSAENRINALNGGDAELTQLTLDKMFASAQKVRMAYADMVSNASKSMTLAGDAFQGNIDNAIRFQEIMAEAYTLGGASATEMSTSMYQMIQALGAGTLAGDELRSVREGAPLAYQAIEKYVQGVMAANESTKDLATQSLKDIAAAGYVTSDMVVAAIMDSGKAMDKAFKDTKVTFGQLFTQIKNIATKAFEPILQIINEKLNKAIKNGLVKKLEKAFTVIANVAMDVFEIVCDVISWIADNWDWLKHLVVAGLMLMITWTVTEAAISVACAVLKMKAWLAQNEAMKLALITTIRMVGVLAVVTMAVLALLYVFYLFKTGAIDACQAITWAILIIGVAIGIVMLIMGNMWGLLVIVITLAIALIWHFFEEVCYGAGWLAAWIVNILFFVFKVILGILGGLLAFLHNCVAAVVNLIAGVFSWIVAGITNIVNWIRNVATAIQNVWDDVCYNIGVIFDNLWIGVQNGFWKFVEGFMHGINYLAKPLDAIAKLFGYDGFDFSSTISNLESKQQAYKETRSISAAWDKGMNTYAYKDLQDAWNKGINTMQYESLAGTASEWYGAISYVDAEDWGKAASDWAGGVKDKLNSSTAKYQNAGDLIDNIGSALETGDVTANNILPNSDDPNSPYSTTGAYKNPSYDELLDGVNSIAGNTGDIADQMSDKDMEYLRKLAQKGWEQKYTNVEVKIDMTNNNTVNSDGDLEGLVTKLRDVVFEELSSAANGVYAN